MTRVRTSGRTEIGLPPSGRISEMPKWKEPPENGDIEDGPTQRGILVGSTARAVAIVRKLSVFARVKRPPHHKGVLYTSFVLLYRFCLAVVVDGRDQFYFKYRNGYSYRVAYIAISEITTVQILRMRVA